jgi:hypothetical protein
LFGLKVLDIVDLSHNLGKDRVHVVCVLGRAFGEGTEKYKISSFRALQTHDRSLNFAFSNNYSFCGFWLFEFKPGVNFG